MPTRELLAPSQRAQLTELPSSFDERTLARFYTLSDEDLRLVRRHRRPRLSSIVSLLSRSWTGLPSGIPGCNFSDSAFGDHSSTIATARTGAPVVFTHLMGNTASLKP